MKISDSKKELIRSILTRDDKVNGENAEWKTISGHHVAIGKKW